MRKPGTCFFLCAGLFLLASPELRSEPKVLIESEFGKKGENGFPRVGEEKDRGHFPLKYPTEAVAEAPTTIEIKKDGIESYTEPVLVFKIGEKDGAASFTRLIWDLSKGKLGIQGIYELTYTVIPLELPIKGGWMQFHLLDPQGNPPLDQVTHITEMPTVSFQEDKIGTTHEQEKLKVGKTYDVRIRLDLNKNRWAAWINGKALVKKEALPESLTNGYPKLGLGYITLSSERGLGDPAGGSYAIGNLKLVKMDSDEETPEP